MHTDVHGRQSASTRNIAVERLRCVLESLRDRTPGKYRHETVTTFTRGEIGADHILLVGADGVAYARDPFLNLSNPAPDPGKRCELEAPSYFKTCIQELESPQEDAAWACAFGDGTATTPSTLFWFASCRDESPLACE